MKATTLYATLALVLGAPVAFSKSEVETLRDRCAEQERQIRQLEQENSRLKGTKETPKPVVAEKAAAEKPVAEKPAPTKSGTYTVRSGDTLEKIARKTGVSALALGKANGIKSETIIRPGQVLKLPGSSTATAARTTEDSKPEPKEAKEPKTAKKDTKEPAKEAKTETAKTETAKTESKSAKEKETPALASTESKTISNPAPKPAPQPKAEATAEAAKAPTTGGAAKPPTIRSIIIQDETSYGSFASLHGTTPERLNDLNGLSLSTSTVLAKGSELYIPAQP
ncbi:LysM peptidoglycan-binding domain-containing protein [Luteolibacter sp. LG18]|uniref:LysM peptidoglycan-binding domain-containing protein n=1 Tax=Luteolibacter sp. LG18 TaxID=2819286 RepID=UPI002B28DFDC|nr:hypothetical protein llg_38650 [Luteolibacter sp. LG18]